MTEADSDDGSPIGSRDINRARIDDAETVAASHSFPLATALPDAEPLSIKTSNACYKGKILLSDGTTPSAILKDLTAVELAKEMLGNALAKRLGLPVPDGYLTIASEGSVPACNGPLSAEGERLVFASVDVAQPSIQFIFSSDRAAGRSMIDALAAWPLLGALYGFDTWVANEDRNAGNILVSGNGDLWLIDHGRIITGPGWPGSSLEPTGDYVSRLAGWLTGFLTPQQVAAAQEEAARLETALRRFDIAEAISASGAAEILGAAALDEAENFLRDRSVLVSYYSNKALGAPTIL